MNRFSPPMFSPEALATIEMLAPQFDELIVHEKTQSTASTMLIHLEICIEILEKHLTSTPSNAEKVQLIDIPIQDINKLSGKLLGIINEIIQILCLPSSFKVIVDYINRRYQAIGNEFSNQLGIELDGFNKAATLLRKISKNNPLPENLTRIITIFNSHLNEGKAHEYGFSKFEFIIARQYKYIERLKEATRLLFPPTAKAKLQTLIAELGKIKILFEDKIKLLNNAIANPRIILKPEDLIVGFYIEEKNALYYKFMQYLNTRDASKLLPEELDCFTLAENGIQHAEFTGSADDDVGKIAQLFPTIQHLEKKFAQLVQTFLVKPQQTIQERINTLVNTSLTSTMSDEIEMLDPLFNELIANEKENLLDGEIIFQLETCKRIIDNYLADKKCINNEKLQPINIPTAYKEKLSGKLLAAINSVIGVYCLPNSFSIITNYINQKYYNMSKELCEYIEQTVDAIQKIAEENKKIKKR